MEEWRDIKGFEGLYQISSYGRVKSLERTVWNGKGYYKKSEKIRKGYDNGDGYLYVNLCKEGKRKQYRINRLVAMAFIPNPNNLPEVNHKDGNKLNNRADNLEWATRSENQKHAYKIGLQKSSEKQKQAVSKWNKENRIKSVHQYKLNGELIKTYKSCHDCSIELNTTNATVSRHCYNGKPLKGYIVKY